MCSPKFSIKEKCLYDEKEVVILVSVKDFSTGEITYKLKSNDVKLAALKIPEAQLSKVQTTLKRKPKQDVGINLLKLQAQYKLIIGKSPPQNKKNNIVWLTQKIEEAGKEQSPYQILAKLNHEQLCSLITEKKLDVDSEDYDEKGLLLIAVCEELNVVMPVK